MRGCVKSALFPPSDRCSFPLPFRNAWIGYTGVGFQSDRACFDCASGVAHHLCGEHPCEVSLSVESRRSFGFRSPSSPRAGATRPADLIAAFRGRKNGSRLARDEWHNRLPSNWNADRQRELTGSVPQSLHCDDVRSVAGGQRSASKGFASLI